MTGGRCDQCAAVITPVITWKAGPYGGFVGQAGGVTLFTLNWRTVATKPEWNMRCKLPGYDGSARVWENDDRDVLKAKALTLLARWLDEITKETP